VLLPIRVESSLSLGSLEFGIVAPAGIVAVVDGDQTSGSVQLKVSVGNQVVPGSYVVSLSVRSGELVASLDLALEVAIGRARLRLQATGLLPGMQSVATVSGVGSAPLSTECEFEVAWGRYSVAIDDVVERDSVSPRRFSPDVSAFEVDVGPGDLLRDVVFLPRADTGLIIHAMEQADQATIRVFAGTSFESSGTPLPVSTTVVEGCLLERTLASPDGSFWVHCVDAVRGGTSLRRYTITSLLTGGTPEAVWQFSGGIFVSLKGEDVWIIRFGVPIIEVLPGAEARLSRGTIVWGQPFWVYAPPSTNALPLIALPAGVIFGDSTADSLLFVENSTIIRGMALPPVGVRRLNGASMGPVFFAGSTLWLSSYGGIREAPVPQFFADGGATIELGRDRSFQVPSLAQAVPSMVDGRGDLWTREPYGDRLFRFEIAQIAAPDDSLDVSPVSTVIVPRADSSERVEAIHLWPAR
jgi:hypothetical protein